MNSIPFMKYHGTGNDFVIVDHIKGKYFDENDSELIRNICARRFGVGADGLMIIKPSPTHDFKMKYYNSDGNISSMCGNGGRCIAAASIFLGYSPKNRIQFTFKNDVYQANYIHDKDWISLKMQDVSLIDKYEGNYILDTGSPHYVKFVDDPKQIDVKSDGASIRNSDPFKIDGINVNFCKYNEVLKVRTYERGVEDETYSCGTGVVASAIANALDKHFENGEIETLISTKGGKLSVSFNKRDHKFSDIFLSGPAIKVFEGEYKV